MNTMEEKLWNYIDGTCTLAEQEAIAHLIEHDDLYARKYQELLTLNQEFAAMELDEPSMAFTYNVMEAIRTENAMQPLKATINKRIILGIVLFFAFTILAMLTLVVAKTNITDGHVIANAKPSVSFKLPAMNNLFSGAWFKWFVMFDVILALFLVDAYLHRKKNTTVA